jgi:hypothetical protein
MRAAVTSLLRDKPPPFQQACFRCILQFQLILLFNRKPVLLYLCYFCVKYLLIISIHFVLLIKSGSVVSERSAPCRLSACPQRGRSTKNWVSSLFLLRTEALTRPSDLPWQGKRKMTGHEILSNY